MDVYFAVEFLYYLLKNIAIFAKALIILFCLQAINLLLNSLSINIENSTKTIILKPASTKKTIEHR